MSDTLLVLWYRPDTKRAALLCTLSNSSLFFLACGDHTVITRFTNKLQFQTYSTTKDYFKYSFFPQTIRIWNTLPASIVVPGPSLNQSKTFFQDSEEVYFFFFVRFYTFTAALSAFRFVGSLFGEKNILQCQVGR
jgi:hypothetical protein